ncbi:hypothetical protein TrVE_jg6378 [Triparma verrucosa]|uniref:BART domain-containing protein n=1 Tax=Triparma verrucosa TaxID=1606542 RepID=A0A9W7BD13_9STRA|nr:hypothetical protein TrVE_jg6378 [Triparma verrucosa]
MAESKSDELVQGEVSNELIVGHGPGLIHRFVNFAFNAINSEMNDFFQENCPKFEQDYEDYTKQGETLEQYACFQEYRERLETSLSKFCETENFDDEEECMAEIQRLVKEDLERHKEQMQKMMEAIQKAQKRAMKAIRKAQRAEEGGGDVESSESEEDGEEEKGGEDGGSSAPMMIFFSPTTLEQLVEMVMNLGEYQTFSMMMRMKVQQQRVMKLLMEARAQGAFGGIGESKMPELEDGKEEEKGGEEKVEVDKVEVEIDDEDDFMFSESL